MSMRATLLAAMGGILGLFALYTAYWLYARGVIESEVEIWIAEQEAAGYQIDHQSLAVGGFPYRFSVRLTAPDIRAPAGDGGWRTEMGAVTAHALPYDFSH